MERLLTCISSEQSGTGSRLYATIIASVQAHVEHGPVSSQQQVPNAYNSFNCEKKASKASKLSPDFSGKVLADSTK